MRKESCDYCAYRCRCSCRGTRKAQTASLGHCFDYEKEDRWTDYLDMILALACAVTMLGLGLAAILNLCLWFLEVIA